MSEPALRAVTRVRTVNVGAGAAPFATAYVRGADVAAATAAGSVGVNRASTARRPGRSEPFGSVTFARPVSSSVACVPTSFPATYSPTVPAAVPSGTETVTGTVRVAP